MRPTHPSLQQARRAQELDKATTAANTVAIAANTALLAVATPASLNTRVAALEAKMQFIPKAFGRFTTIATPALLGTSHNVTSVSKTSTGIYAVVIGTDMTTANYTVMLSYEDATATIQTIMASSIATTGFSIGIRDSSNALSDVSESISFAVFENNT